MIRFRSVWSLVTLALVAPAAASCGASSRAAQPAAGSTVVLGSPSDDSALADRATMAIRNEASTGSREIGAEVGAVWRGLQDVLAEFELPIAQLDASAGRLQMGGRMPRIDGKRMSHWFDCGRSMTGAVADRSTIAVAMAIQLRATTAGTTVLDHATQATASPRDNPGNTLACTSEGRLEAFIFEAVAARVGGGGE
ncbi:MAG: hypothetical protein HKO98_06405 [Gemmatimonadetes bacterium]|nr:hypothetical protein [Gemmatimonadota bacterium]